MKIRKILQISLVLIGGISVIGCQNQKSSNIKSPKKVKIEKKKSIDIYPVKVTKILYKNKANYVICGDADVPDNTRIMIQTANKLGSNDDDAFKVDDSDEVVTVKNKKFKAEIDSTELSDDDEYKTGKQLRIKVFAVKGISDDDTEINSDMRNQLMQKKYKETIITINQLAAEYTQAQNTVENYETDVDDALDGYETVGDPKVTWKDNAIYINLKVRSRDLFDQTGENGFLPPILEEAKKISSNSPIKYIIVKIYGSDDSAKDVKSERYSIEHIKQVNWEKVDKIDNSDDLNDFFDNFKED